MTTGLTEERRALRAAVRDLLTRESGSAALRAAAESPAGYDRELWDRLCGEIGVAALAVPEKFGGVGASIRETCVVAGELGRTLTPAPLLGSAVFAAAALLAGGDDAAGADLLPDIAAGKVAALALTGPAGHWRPEEPAYTAEPDGTGWKLTGTAHYVLDGDRADILLVAGKTPDGIGLFEVDPATTHREATPTMDITRRLATVELAGIPARRRVGADAGPALRRALDAACVVLAAEQAGAAERCLELTVDYTKARVQFGRPIGGFQALKHRMADMYVRVETARSAAEAAADAYDGPHATVDAAVAKLHCAEAFSAVAAEMIQLHGGIGITWEHDAQLYFKRAHGSAHLFGGPAGYLDRLTAELRAGRR